MNLIKKLRAYIMNKRLNNAMNRASKQFTYNYPNRKVCEICGKVIKKNEKCIVEKYLREDDNIKFYCMKCIDEERRIQQLAEEFVCPYYKSFRDKGLPIMCSEIGCSKAKCIECQKAMHSYLDEYYEIKYNIERDWVEKPGKQIVGGDE